DRQMRETKVLDPDSSAKQFSAATTRSTFWYHHGHIGRWVRENALPALTLRSTRSPAPLRMVLILLDPRCHDVCKAHADRRNSRRRKDSAPYTSEHIKIEIAATVISLAKAMATIPSFSAQVFVSDLDVPFRLDLCDDYGFITHEDQTAPCFGFESDSPFYATSSAYFENFHASVVREVDLGVIDFNSVIVTAASIPDILSQMQLEFPELTEKDVRSGIAKRVNGA
ncbi:MAG: hypothetical protein ACXWCW_31790, partial [Burkholderiales bacterium]